MWAVKGLWLLQLTSYSCLYTLCRWFPRRKARKGWHTKHKHLLSSKVMVGYLPWHKGIIMCDWGISLSPNGSLFCPSQKGAGGFALGLDVTSLMCFGAHHCKEHKMISWAGIWARISVNSKDSKKGFLIRFWFVLFIIQFRFKCVLLKRSL